MKQAERSIARVLGVFLCLALWAQAAQGQDTKPNKKYVDDEECGCELVFVDGIQTTQRNGLFGFKLEDGTELVPPKYKFVDEFRDGFCIVLGDYEQVGMINRRGEEILPCVFQEVVYPTEGIIKARRGDLYGFYDTTGREMLAPQWRAASSFFEGRAVVSVQLDSFTAGYGYIDTAGRMVLPPVYEYAYPFSEGRAAVKQYDRMGLIDAHGREVIPIKYGFLSSMNHGRVFARDGETGLLAMFDGGDGQRMTPFAYDDVTGYGEGCYVVRRNNMLTYLDEKKGRERYGLYDMAGPFMEGFACVARGGKYGILNRRGKKVLPLEYDNTKRRPGAYVFHEGLALVEKDGRMGFVNTKGKVVIPLQYESAFYFTEGLAPVCKDGAWGYIDHQGREVIPFLFGPSSVFEYGRASVIYNNETYKIDPSGQCVKNCSTFPTAEVQRRMARLAVERNAIQ